MPAAVPGVGECKICFEIVPSVKVLDCGHSLCFSCASRIVESQKKVQDPNQPNASVATSFLACPECRGVTECGSQGARSLKTRYFGSLKCDLCLEKKDTDDCWWCSECVRTLCSKCSIKEHSKKGHTISEWNKLDPVKYSVNYISQVKIARQGSTEAEHNRQVVNTFMQSVEKALQRELASQPELDRIQNDLFDRYGSRFKQPLPALSMHRGSSSSPNLLAKEKHGSSMNDDGPRVVAKVLQLAGANVLETLIPSLSDQKFQLHFTVSPDEIAKYLRSKIEFIPFDLDVAACKRRIPSAPSSVSSINSNSNVTGNRHSYHNFMDRISEEAGSSSQTPPDDGIGVYEEIFLSTSTAGKGQIVELDYDGHSLIALRYSTSEVCVLNLITRKTLSTVPIQLKHECRSLAFSETSGLLYLALQSTAKRHEWMLEAIDLMKSPTGIIFTAPFDIDPEDRVENLQISIGAKKEPGLLYEIRVCSRNVSEIWRASMERKSKTPSKVKLKETMIYQKDESRFTQVLVAQMQGGKEHALFVWDDHSKALYRLTIKDKRCYCTMKIANAPTPIPCSLDASDRLWIFDPCTHFACVSHASTLNKLPITFREVYRTRYALRRLWADISTEVIGGEFVFGIHLSPDSKSLKIVKFKKGDVESEGRSSRSAGLIKRRSLSSQV